MTALIDRSFREKIIIVGLVTEGVDPEEVERSLDELARLVDTAGADVVARVTQRRRRPDPATYVGRGKATELHELSEQLDVDTVVFDDELTPAQQFNLEKILGRTAIDRTAVILDIFAQNARTPEGRAQVELAQHQYRLPRLRGRGRALSQQAGMIGTRGPGETQLEVDRRRIERRIHTLRRTLADIDRQRHLQRKARHRRGLPLVTIVGYTNAGKSTLLNRLTDAGVLVEDRLFATLDDTTRRLRLPSGTAALVSDTVGFVRRLPHTLVEAFKSTLEVAVEADLLIHVVDGAAPDADEQVATVRQVLAEIGADGVPELVAVNKRDRDPEAVDRLVARMPGAIPISAATGEGVDALLAAVEARVADLRTVQLLVPWDRGDVLAALHREGRVLEAEPTDVGTRVTARLDGRSATELADLVTPG